MIEFIILCAVLAVGIVCGIISIVKVVRSKKAQREALNENVTAPTKE